MKCRNCKEEFDSALASCGTGYSWSLYKCPHCGQYQADGYCPQQVLDDDTIIVFGKREPDPRLFIGKNAGYSYAKESKAVSFGYKELGEE